MVIHAGMTEYVKSLNLDFNRLHPFGYYMVFKDGKNVALVGKTNQTTMYAVTDFLKRYAGYRKFAAGELYEIVPEQKAITLPASFEFKEEPSVGSYYLAPGAGNESFGRNGRLNCMATHALDSLVPPALYATSHPEYYPLIKGERKKINPKGRNSPWNPCVSHDDIPMLVEKYAADYFKKYPQRSGLPVGVNDGGGDCQCDKCVAVYKRTGNQYVEFYNQAADVLAKTHPDKVLAFIAYSRVATDAPKNLQMRPNILAEITGIKHSAFGELPKWRAAGIKHFGIYDYIYAMGHSFITPRYFPHIMAKYWRDAYKEYGLESMWLEYFPAVTVFEAPRQYVLDELAWNMNVDIDALLDDYFRSMYGEAAKEVRKFFDILEETYGRTTKPDFPFYGYRSAKQMEHYSFKDLERLDAALAKVEKAATTPAVKRKVDLLKKIYTFCKLNIESFVCGKELQKIGKVSSLDQCRKVTALVARGYQTIAKLQAYTMSPADEKLLFNYKLKFKDMKSLSTFQPLPIFEGKADGALAKVTAYLVKNKKKVDDFYAAELKKCADSGYHAALNTQLYLMHNVPQNLVKNGSFEEVRQAGDKLQPVVSDHQEWKGAPGWATWTFPNSVTRFFLHSEAHSGKFSGAIGERQIGGSLINYVTIESGCRYRLRFWVRRNRGDDGFGCGNASVRFQRKGKWLDNGSAIAVAYPPECENKWVMCETSFTAPEGGDATALLLFGATAQNEGTFTCIDDVTLEKIYEPERKKKVISVDGKLSSQLQYAVQVTEECLDKAAQFLPALQIRLEQRTVGPDGAFEFNASGENVTIAGDDEGLRCGLYSLLNTLGIYWFNPSEEILLPTRKVQVDLSKLNGLNKPDFSYRGLHICAGKHHYDERVARWMSFNRMNRKLTHHEEDQVVGEALKRLGLRPDTSVHAYSLLISDEKYFDSNPEFFSLVGGKRIKNSAGGQLCLSNKQMRQAFAAELLEIIRRKPHISVFGICPNDGYGHCECAECRKLDSATDSAKGLVNARVADFVKEICHIIGQKAPGVMLGHYSYSNFADFMKYLPEPPKNLLVSFTQFHCFRHAMDDPSCPKNRPLYQRMLEVKSKVENVYIYDYYTNRGGNLPAPFLTGQHRDFKMWKEQGIAGFMSEVGGYDAAPWESFWPMFYYAAQLLWNAEVTPAAVVGSFCQARYGAAAAAMTEYFGALQSAMDALPQCYSKNAGDFVAFFTPALRQKCQSILAKAQSLSPDNQLLQKEVTLFNSWCDNADVRAKYQSVTAVTPRAMDAPGFAPQKIFTVSQNTQLPDLENDTAVEVAASHTHIRFRIKLHEQFMDKLKVDKGVYGGDNVEIFLNDGAAADKCYHFIVDTDGQVIASECQGSRWNWSWKHHAEIKVAKDKAGWNVDFTIPKQDLNNPAVPAFSIIRNRYAGGKWQILGTPNGGAFFHTDKYIQIK